MQFQTTVITVGEDWKLLSYEKRYPFLVQADGKAIEIYMGLVQPTKTERGFTAEQWEAEKQVAEVYARAKNKQTSVSVICFRAISHMNPSE